MTISLFCSILLSLPSSTLKVSIHCLLFCNASDKFFFVFFILIFVPLDTYCLFFFSECFQDFLFISSFQQFDRDVSYCGIPYVSSLWGSLTMLTLGFIIFIKLKKIVGHSFLSSPTSIFLRHQLHIFETTWYSSFFSSHFSFSALYWILSIALFFKFTDLFFFSF